MLLSSGFIALHLNVFMADVVIPIIWEERAATSNTNQFLRTVLTEDAWIVISVELTSTGNRCGVAPSPINSTLKQTHQTRSQLYIDEFLLLNLGGGGVQWKHRWSRHNVQTQEEGGVTREVVGTYRWRREREIQQGHYYSSHKEEVREMQKLGDHTPWMREKEREFSMLALSN
jgi:hypothetical protein